MIRCAKQFNILNLSYNDQPFYSYHYEISRPDSLIVNMWMHLTTIRSRIELRVAVYNNPRILSRAGKLKLLHTAPCMLDQCRS